MSESHFLVVDDDADSLEMIVEYLRFLGHEQITQCRDGAEAIRTLERDPTINFIISDWDMPYVNGLSFLQRVRSQPSKAHIPFLMVTSPISHESEKVIMAAESLVDSYLIKPFRADVLRQRIEKILETPTHGPQKQVVVVDDDADAREMIVEYLVNMGFKDVHPIAGGLPALAYLKSNSERVGLIVSDWEMPGISGIELLKECKAQPALTEIPFLMVTSQSSIERIKVMQAARANVDQYLLKPFNSEEMKKRVEHLLQKARSRGEVKSLVAEALNQVQHTRLHRAQELFEAALQLDPEYDVALRGLGEILMKTKGVEAALPYLKSAVDANPANALGYIKLAFAYEQIGWFEKAIALLQSGTQQISFHPDLHFHLGRLYNKRGMLAEARMECEKALELQLDHQEARLTLEMIMKAQRE